MKSSKQFGIHTNFLLYHTVLRVRDAPFRRVDACGSAILDLFSNLFDPDAAVSHEEGRPGQKQINAATGKQAMRKKRRACFSV